MLPSSIPELPTGGNKDLFYDLPVPAAPNDELNKWLHTSRQQSESDGEDDSSDGLGGSYDSEDSSLTDYDGYEYTLAVDPSYPNKKPKSYEDTHTEGCKDYEAEDEPQDPCYEPETRSSSQQQTAVLSESDSSDDDGFPIPQEADIDYAALEKAGYVLCKADRRCKAETLSSPQHKPDLSSERLASDDDYGITADREYSIIPGKEEWVRSWSVKNGNEKKGYHYLNVYGFYKLTSGMGGFGVIVRDPFGKPVIASAHVQPKGVSLYYHVLQGVEAVLALALEHGIYDVELMCNSSTLDNNLRQMFKVADHGLYGTGRAPYECGACKTCLRFAVPLTDDEFDVMFPLLVKIIDKHSEIKRKSRIFAVSCVPSSANQAAYHMVKQLAKKTPRSAVTNHVTIKPKDFDDELKMIVYEDAYKGVRLYHRQLRELKQLREFKQRKSTAAMKRLR